MAGGVTPEDSEVLSFEDHTQKGPPRPEDEAVRSENDPTEALHAVRPNGPATVVLSKVDEAKRAALRDLVIRGEVEPTEPVEIVDDGETLDRTEPIQAVSAPEDELIGVLLDQRYEILEKIGRGGMGAVYRALQVTVGREVAVKILKSGVDPATEVRFNNEARIIRELRHANTVKIIDYGRTPDGRPYFVTELLSGRNLRLMIRDGRIDVLRTVSIVRQVCQALAEAHGLGIVHRDLKPENVFIEDVAGEDMVKVLDFGMALAADQPRLTRTGMFVGTPGYVAPESVRGQPADTRSDIFSLGVLAYECLAGSRPFAAEGGRQTVHDTLNKPVRPFSSHVPPVEVPPEIEGLIMRLLAKEPAERPATVTEVWNALDQFERRFVGDTGRDPTRVPVTPRSETAPMPARRSPRWAPIAAGAIALLLALALFFAALSAR